MPSEGQCRGRGGVDVVYLWCRFVLCFVVDTLCDEYWVCYGISWACVLEACLNFCSGPQFSNFCVVYAGDYFNQCFFEGDGTHLVNFCGAGCFGYQADGDAV